MIFLLERTASRRRGFTLIEVIAALTIMGAVLVTLIAAVGADLRASGTAHDAQEMTTAASIVVERLSVRTRDELLDIEDGWHQLAPPLDRYRWQADVREAPAEPALLNVTITINRVRGADHGMTLSTRLFRPSEEEGRIP